MTDETVTIVYDPGTETVLSSQDAIVIECSHDDADALSEGTYDEESGGWLRSAPVIDALRLRELASILITNARLVPDPSMNGATDLFGVPIDDVEALADALGHTLP